MEFKEGVKVQGIRPELLLAMIVSEQVYNQHGYTYIVTSLLDGKHSVTSLHYSGCAVDSRTRHIEPEHRKVIADQIRDKLTKDYDVVLELSHLHIEYQPRHHK